MTNILKAIQNLISGHEVHVGEVRESNNRANSLGEAFEVYIKNVFAGAFGLTGTAYQKKIEEAFSYQGSASKPPDLMIRGGDAIEIKKLQTKDSQIQLNSSFPKNKLHIEDSRVSSEAKNAEVWTEKDILYVVGNVDAKAKTVKSMWWVYGDCFCADSSVYQSVSNKISDALTQIEEFDFSPTNELGRINGVDAQRFTDLRIRGMWLLKNPHKIFEGYAPFDRYAMLQLFVLMQEKKWQSFSQEDRAAIEKLVKSGILTMTSEKVANPDNPAQSLDCRLIKFTIR